jgi:hypothetical protein
MGAMYYVHCQSMGCDAAIACPDGSPPPKRCERCGGFVLVLCPGCGEPSLNDWAECDACGEGAFGYLSGWIDRYQAEWKAGAAPSNIDPGHIAAQAKVLNMTEAAYRRFVNQLWASFHPDHVFTWPHNERHGRFR